MTTLNPRVHTSEVNPYLLEDDFYASSDREKPVKSEPATDIAKNILGEHSLDHSKQPIPLKKERVTSLLDDKSKLEDYFDSINDDCLSIDEDDLIEEIFEDEEVEKPNQRSETEDFLDSKDIEVQGLQNGFKWWTNTLKGYLKYSNMFLRVSEYITNNKDVFIDSIKLVRPDEGAVLEVLLETYDDVFKWVDCSLPVLINFIHGIAIFRFKQKAENIQNSIARFVTNCEAQGNETQGHVSSSSSSNGILKSHYHVNHFQQSKLDRDWSEVQKKGGLKLVRLISRFVASRLACLEILELKTANKTTKSIYEILKSGMEIWDYRNMERKQREWLFHLQPYFLVNIEPENPTLEEEDAIEAQIDAQEELIEEVKSFLVSLENCNSLEEVEKIFKKINVPFVLPPSIHHFKQTLQNPRLCRDLVQCYYYYAGRRALINPSKLSYAIKKKEEEHAHNIDRSIPFIAEQINECQKQNLSFKEIQAYFAKLHIDIHSLKIPNNDLPLPPTDELEWAECIQDNEFIQALAGKWVDYQEATAQMAMQALRQALLSKHHVERKFLLFQAIEIGVGILSTIIQLSLCSPQIKLLTISSVLEILVADMAKWASPTFGVFYLASPLYPGLKFKIEALFMKIAKHFFAISYKPNEYSLDGYLLTLKLRWTNLVMLYYSLQFILQKASLWIDIHLVDNCIKGLDIKSMTEDQRYDNLREQHADSLLNYRHEIENIENELWKLQLKDAKLIIDPQSQKTSKGFKPSDPIETLANALIEADIDYFPPLVIEFFENQVGFKLSNSKKAELEEHLQELFVKNDDKFFSSYISNRFAYLKP